MITGLTRVRNEELIIEDTLNHFFQFCDHIILFDDDSIDNTVEIAKSVGNVSIIHGPPWHPFRELAETSNRYALVNFAKQLKLNWCLYFDADERIVSPLPEVSDHISAYKFRLFDGYMTPECSEDYKGGALEHLPRMWGREERKISFLFQANHAEYKELDQREPIINGPVVQSNAFVKHFGKCISEKQYYDTCDYYANHFPKYSEKWKQRRIDGHMRIDKSDFGTPLLTWDEILKL